jgi:hypothetical protein
MKKANSFTAATQIEGHPSQKEGVSASQSLKVCEGEPSPASSSLASVSDGSVSGLVLRKPTLSPVLKISKESVCLNG